MKQIQQGFCRADKRGLLREISRGDWKQVNLLKIYRGETFGGHYHKERSELFFVLSGQVMFKEADALVCTGTSLIIEPYDKHTFYAVEDSEIIELLSQEFDERDTWK